jgi:outer membrane protein assembly factor BamE (lipoprotein component of BamABCDE complex)
MTDRTAGGRLAVLLGLVGLVISAWSLMGCSSQNVGSSTDSPQRFDQKVLDLRPGASLEDVTASLGEPVSEATDGSETALNYYSWRLHFQEGELRQRVRQTRSGRTSLAGSMLDRKILFGLMPGMTIRGVRKKLGTPEVYEQIYESARKPAVVLRYAYWELYFLRGRLVRRTKN